MKQKTIPLFLVILLILSFLASLFFVVPAHATSQVTLVPSSAGSYSQFVEVPNAGFVFGSQFENGSITGDGWTGSTVSGTTTITASTANPHTGTYGCRINYAANTRGAVYENITAASLLNVRFYFYTNNVTTTGLWYNIFTTQDAPNTYVRVDYHNSIPCLTIGEAAGIASTYGATTLAINTWYCIEVQIYYNAAGYRKVLLNGTSEISVSSGLQSTATITRFNIGSPNNNVANPMRICDFDCVVASSSAIGVENRPALVNDSSDNTALQVTANVTEKETLNLADSGLTGYTINSVTAYMRAKGTATTNQAVIQWRTHSTDYNSSDTNMTTSFALYSAVDTMNPNTGAAWTWAEVDALEIGARASTLATGTIQFSEFYIIVDYTTVTYENFYGKSTLNLATSSSKTEAFTRYGLINENLAVSAVQNFAWNIYSLITETFTVAQANSYSFNLYGLIQESLGVNGTHALAMNRYGNVGIDFAASGTFSKYVAKHFYGLTTFNFNVAGIFSKTISKFLYGLTSLLFKVKGQETNKPSGQPASPYGMLTVKVTDWLNNPIQNATVTVFNYYTNQTINITRTDVNGTCLVSVPYTTLKILADTGLVKLTSYLPYKVTNAKTPLLMQADILQIIQAILTIPILDLPIWTWIIIIAATLIFIYGFFIQKPKQKKTTETEEENARRRNE